MLLYFTVCLSLNLSVCVSKFSVIFVNPFFLLPLFLSLCVSLCLLVALSPSLFSPHIYIFFFRFPVFLSFFLFLSFLYLSLCRFLLSLTFFLFLSLSFTLFYFLSRGRRGSSVGRARDSQEVLGWIPALAARSLLVGSVSA